MPDNLEKIIQEFSDKYNSSDLMIGKQIIDYIILSYHQGCKDMKEAVMEVRPSDDALNDESDCDLCFAKALECWSSNIKEIKE